VAKGAYVLSDSDGTPDLILIGTGSEVKLCVEAAEQLRAQGTKVRVVSMPSWELFDAQDASLSRIGTAQGCNQAVGG
jgi:transketolase